MNNLFRRHRSNTKIDNNTDSASDELITVKIKPSLYVTYKPNSATPSDFCEKQAAFIYIPSTKELLIEGSYTNKDGAHYYPYIITQPDAADEIFEICIALFDKMKPDNYNGTTEQGLDLPKYFGVKTVGGACRKFEYFTFNYSKRWNQETEDYYFCKGERNRNGYSLYTDFIIGQDLEKELFIKGYNKEFKRIEKKLAKKENAINTAE